jgi:hypothetical protein
MCGLAPTYENSGLGGTEASPAIRKDCLAWRDGLSVKELLEEGQSFEAEILEGVEFGRADEGSEGSPGIGRGRA